VTPPAKPVDWEIEMAMPLGVLANQLIKIEGDLRFLSMKAAEYSVEDGSRSSKRVYARLALIHEVLDSIHAQLAKVQSGFHTTGADALFTTTEPAVYSRKPSPELDD
jgi:hypothetical protein